MGEQDAAAAARGIGRAVRSRLTYANTMSTVAVFVALGGGAYAAATIGPNDIRRGAVRSSHIKDGTIVARDIAPRTLRSLRGRTGPAGAQGPAGPAGPAGATGPAGPAGAPAASEFRSFAFDERTFTSNLNLTIDVERSFVDRAALLVQYSPATEAETSWYSAPGIGSGGIYQVRTYITQTRTDPSQYLVGIRLMRADGSGVYTTPVTWRKTRILLLPG